MREQITGLQDNIDKTIEKAQSVKGGKQKMTYNQYRMIFYVSFTAFCHNAYNFNSHTYSA